MSSATTAAPPGIPPSSFDAPVVKPLKPLKLGTDLENPALIAEDTDSTAYAIDEAAPFSVQLPILKRTYSDSTGGASDDSNPVSPVDSNNGSASTSRPVQSGAATKLANEGGIDSDINQLLSQLSITEVVNPINEGEATETSTENADTEMRDIRVHEGQSGSHPSSTVQLLNANADARSSHSTGIYGLEVANPIPTPTLETTFESAENEETVVPRGVQSRALIFELQSPQTNGSSRTSVDGKHSLEQLAEIDSGTLVSRSSSDEGVGELYEAPAIQNSYLESVIFSIDPKTAKSVAGKPTNKPNIPTRKDLLPHSAHKQALISRRRCAYRLTNSDTKTERALVGTAVYIGRGIFLTAAHNLQVPTGSTDNQLLLDHGDKRRDSKISAFGELKNPGCFYADPVAYMTSGGKSSPCSSFIPTPEFEKHIPNSNGITLNHALDLAVIKLRPGQDVPPDTEALQPFPLAQGMSTFPSKFWGCNYASQPEIKLAYDAYYKYTGMGRKELDNLIDKLRSGECTRAKGEAANFVTVTGSPAVSTEKDALFVRHDISAINGASGSAITMRYLDGDKKKHDGLVGIHVKAVYRLRDGQGAEANPPIPGAKYRLETENYAVNIHNPDVRKFLAEVFSSLSTEVDMSGWAWRDFASRQF